MKMGAKEDEAEAARQIDVAQQTLLRWRKLYVEIISSASPA